MNVLSMEDADKLRELLNENPGVPVFILTKTDGNQHNSRSMITINGMEKGKILADETLIKADIAITTDEELRLMIRDCLGGYCEDDDPDYRDPYDEDPDGYIADFAEEAEKYKKKWQPAILVYTDVVNEDAEDEERDW